MNKIRYIIIGITGFILYTICLSGITRYVVNDLDRANRVLGKPATKMINSLSETLLFVKILFDPQRYYVKNKETRDGIIIYNNDLPKGLKLLTNFSTGRYDYHIQLLDIETGKVIKEWKPDMKKISDMSYNKSHPRFSKGEDIIGKHPIMLKDSSLILNTTYSLFKINSNSDIEWVNTKVEAHHSIEFDHNGFIWIAARRIKSKLDSMLISEEAQYKIMDDIIVQIDPDDGKILYQKSVIQILLDNDNANLLYIDGHVKIDPVHLNDVQPALTDGKYWKKGDLLMSSRHISAIFLFRPETNELVWFKQGPWLNQHDADFYEDDKIVVFGNQIYLGDGSPYYTPPDDFNKIFVYNFSNDSVSEPYRNMIEKNNIKTRTEGRSEILPNGDIFIEETNRGRIVIGDSVDKKMEFVKRINKNYITILSWSRIILN